MKRKCGPTDEQRLHAHLDVRPDDLTTRLVLADLLEEQGRDDEAKAQRLLAELKRWPDNDLTFCNQTGWHWWTRAEGEHKHRRHAVIPFRLRKHMPGGEWLYKTRRQAEEVFLKALRAAGKL